MFGVTSRLVCDSQVGSKRIVNDRRFLTVFRHDFVELCPFRQRSSVQSAGLPLLARPELLLILEMVRDVKFHATCSFMALPATHGLRHYCHNGQGCHRHYFSWRAVWRNDDGQMRSRSPQGKADWGSLSGSWKATSNRRCPYSKYGLKM